MYQTLNINIYDNQRVVTLANCSLESPKQAIAERDWMHCHGET